MEEKNVSKLLRQMRLSLWVGGRKNDGTSLKEGKSKHVSRELVGLEFRMIQRYLLMESTLYSNGQRVSEGNCFSRFSQRKQ